MTTWLLAAVLVFVLFITSRMFIQKYQIDSEIKKLQTQADKIKHDNEQLSSLINYLQTPEYSEKSAREKLNLKKDGEYVVVLPPNAGNTDQAQAGQKDESNAKQWFDYFFSNE